MWYYECNFFPHWVGNESLSTSIQCIIYIKKNIKVEDRKNIVRCLIDSNYCKLYALQSTRDCLKLCLSTDMWPPSFTMTWCITLSNRGQDAGCGPVPTACTGLLSLSRGREAETCNCSSWGQVALNAIAVWSEVLNVWWLHSQVYAQLTTTSL